LSYGLTIPIVVIVCDIVQISLMVFALYIPGVPLATIGDAIASFLTKPDSVTVGSVLDS
jgi:hypothetical protein